MSTKPTKKDQELESLQEQIVRLQKQLESFKYSNDHFLKNKLFLHYDIKEPEKVVVDCETKLPVLKEVKGKKIQKGKESDPTHLIIEGDNYHALSVLNYTHAGKIDLIYIDPPYNTGNKDFIYNDRFVDREDSFRHSKWLSFMAHRLRLAKNLLAETGVIFISIDDNEQAHLRLLCDQIFGEENFVGCICRATGTTTGQDAARIGSSFDYLLVYKRSDEFTLGGVPLSDGDVNRFNGVDERGQFSVLQLRKTGNSDRREDRPNMFYPIQSPEGNDVFPFGPTGYESRWRFSQETYKKYCDEGLIVWKKSRSGEITPYVKYYLDGRTKQVSNIWNDIDGNKKGSLELKDIFGEKVFDNPKPISLIERILQIGARKSAIILDFFAGSGTTGHAVLKLNAQDDGTRQFILCTNNENKIAEEVTYPRIKKVIDGYSDNAPIPANLRYFQTDFVEKKGSASQLKIDLTRQCAEMLCVKENVFEAVKLKKSAKNYRLFKNGDKYLGVFFDFFTDAEFAGFIKELNALPKEAEKAVYVFVLDGSAGILADEFAGVANCEVKEIPQKILDMYKQLAREVARK
jgi:adenine-specific DNA-methyltransferase